MRKAVIRHGDPTTTGGMVFAFSSTFTDDRKRIALSGDEATCGQCKGTFGIFGTGQGISEKGRDAVVDGDLVLCPCGKNHVLIGANPGIFLESRGSTSEQVARTAMPPVTAQYSPQRENVREKEAHHADRYALIDQHSGRPIANTPYAIKRVNGAVEHGTTDAAGHTHLLSVAAQAEAIEIYLEA